MSEIHLACPGKRPGPTERMTSFAHAPNFDGTVGRILSDGDEHRHRVGVVFHAHGPDHLHASRQHEGQRTDATPGGEASRGCLACGDKGDRTGFHAGGRQRLCSSQVWDVGTAARHH